MFMNSSWADSVWVRKAAVSGYARNKLMPGTLNAGKEAFERGVHEKGVIKAFMELRAA
jgi:hypothetical protein